MLFKTSLTGLNAASSEFQVTANNIANVGTDGFKRSRATFSDLFQSSQAMRKSVAVGQGSTLKRIVQDFGQGGIKTTENALDLAITGPGFFPLQTDDGQSIFTRNGTFKVDENNVVRNALGAALMVAEAGSDGSADLTAPLRPLIIPSQTTGEALATSEIDFKINFNAESPVVNNTQFDRTDPSTYTNSAAIRVYDSEGTEYLAFSYYQRTQAASLDQPLNKYRSYIFIGDQQVTPVLQQAQTEAGSNLWMNRYGEIRSEDSLAQDGVSVSQSGSFFRKFSRDDQIIKQPSVPASIVGASIPRLEVDGLSVDSSRIDLSQAFTISSDGSNPISIDLSSLEGLENESPDIVASLITREINNQMMGDQNFVVDAGNKTFSVSFFNPETEDQTTAFPVTLGEGVYTKEQIAVEIQTKTNLEVALTSGLASESVDDLGNRSVIVKKKKKKKK